MLESKHCLQHYLRTLKYCLVKIDLDAEFGIFFYSSCDEVINHRTLKKINVLKIGHKMGYVYQWL